MNQRFISFLLFTISLLPITAQELRMSRNVQDCGEVAFRSPTLAVFDGENTGDKPLYIVGAHRSCGCTRVEYPTEAIAPGEKFKVNVIYDAKTLGHFEKYVILNSNTTEGSTEIWIKGEVVEELTTYEGEYPYKLGLLESEECALEFDDVNIGDRPKKYFHVLNPTNREAEPNIMHLPTYMKADVSPSRIKPGQTALVTLTLDSRSIRDFGLTQTSVYLGFSPGDKVSPETELPISVVLLPNFSKMTNAERTLAPKVEVSGYELDFSAINSKKPKGKVTITNRGRLPLVISNVQMSTEGIHLSLGNTTLQSGETTTLNVKADRSVLQRVKNKPRILMVTNDPEHPKIEIKIKM